MQENALHCFKVGACIIVRIKNFKILRLYRMVGFSEMFIYTAIRIITKCFTGTVGNISVLRHARMEVSAGLAHISCKTCCTRIRIDNPTTQHIRHFILKTKHILS